METIFKNFLAFFEFSSTLMMILFFVVFVLFLTTIFVVIGHVFRRKNEIAKSPQLTLPARVVSRRTAVWGEHAHTIYYATFELQNGNRVELSMNGQEYGMLADGDLGTLTYRGPKFISFVR